MFRMQLYRAFHAKMLPYALVASLLVMVACFFQTCLHFWGHDVAELPSAAVMWVGNYQTADTSLFCYHVYYLMFPLSAAVFGDSFFSDVRNGAAPHVATRASLATYVWAGAAAAFAAAFLLVLSVLGASQLLTLLAFPLAAGQDSCATFLSVAASDADGALLSQPTLFSVLFHNYRYLYNLVYCVYDALWAGVMAFASYVTSLYVRSNRLVVLGLPTLVFLTCSALLRGVYNVAEYLLPTFGASRNSTLFFAAPVVVLAVSAVLLVIPLRLKRDVLL